ncbi:MAG TPA: polyprenol phosphomannose-dependent alpha 1,6 mannosyltransferase MptB [Solirubrobacteraceae bacterium]|jgi:alpha-1,6-mannosyltransferase|nr:polyprenol phosphomannose-dependent alpha 1,6 mannosyltransferase MptB [Solirubrobacteraceae bacterium]
MALLACWAALGTAGSALVALSGPRLLGAGAPGWWFDPNIAGARGLFYAGIALLCIAWLGLGRRLPSVRALWAIGAAWCIPVVLGPAVFSRDVYSYLAQGELLHLGLNPYHAAPVALAAHGHAHLLDAVSPFWRHTTAPYGPLFLGIVSVFAGAVASHLVAGVLVLRLLDLIGVALIAVFAPRLARALGADPGRAVWLAALSPLVLLQLIAASHNDALMAGLMVAGVALALEGHPLAGVALCAIAATIKLPAAAAVLFIAAAQMRVDWRFAVRAAVVSVVVVGVVTLAVGVGFDWITSGVFSTPQKVRLAITPSTGVGYTIASILHDFGAYASARSIESVVAAVAGALIVALGAWLLWRVRRTTLVRDLGVFLVAAALGGPAAWPWYLVWGIVLLAAWPGAQRSVALAAAVTLPVFLVKPDGILLLDRSVSPAVVVVYIALGVAAWFTWRHRRPSAAVVTA